jgi:hypothetical protein
LSEIEQLLGVESCVRDAQGKLFFDEGFSPKSKKAGAKRSPEQPDP